MLSVHTNVIINGLHKKECK